ncbi:Lipoxygenase y domain-containing protein 1 [Desmophyllum pertusum]|uniref:Lipoxygenase y domain-containing protein 1 n=1 Tax=Desmophyllum pertusum TaxID=174260 RepID=A0A9X0D7Q7_9CNID|nr:Lipoxygenase y domain-containing protein 1 [Desmophyllum pertusum]
MKKLLRGNIFAWIVITCLATRGHYQGSNTLWRHAPREDRRDALNDPQDSNALKENSLREKTHKESDNSLHKRDRSPPRSAVFSSLSTDAMLARAETVLRAIRDAGCPSKEEDFFNITVYTNDLRLAGTTSRVYINIYGMLYGLEESTTKIHLTNNDEKEFTRGRWVSFIKLVFKAKRRLFSVDSFMVKTKFVGLVERITIEHDNTGILPDWDLDKVVVHNLKLGTVQTYMCNCELAGYENQLTLPPI